MRSVGLIVLAAGASRRMARPKQLLPYRGQPLLRHAATTALESGLGPVVVVLGAEEDRCAAALAGLRVTLAYNADWMEGMGSSVRCGICALEAAAPVEGALLLLHDQPALTAEGLRRLAEAWDPDHHPIAAAAYAETVGVPALIHRSFFGELKELEADRGAKGLLLRHADRLARVEMPEAALDIDTPEDYARAG